MALQGLDGPEMSSKHFEAMLRTGWVVFGGVKGLQKMVAHNIYSSIMSLRNVDVADSV